MSEDHHAHDHHDHPRGSSTLLGVALALTGAFMLVEFAGGILSRSLALMADAGHMLTDTASIAIHATMNSSAQPLTNAASTRSR